MADGYLNFDTAIDTSGFNKDANKISGTAQKSAENVTNSFNGSAESIGTSFKQVGKILAAAFSVKAAVSFGKESIEAAASVNAANSQLEQTFGDLEGAAKDAMKRVADESGIVETRLQGVGTSIYAFAKTSGMESAEAMNMMEESLKVAADSAAYYDRSLEDTSETLKSFLKGNYANDAALGISCTETTRNAAANKLYGKSFQDLSEAQKQLTLLQMVKDANALSGAEGQAAREADGWENVLGNLKETWNQFLAVVGQPILSVAVTVVQHLTEIMGQLTSVAREAASAIADVFGVKLGSSAEKTSKSTKTMDKSAKDAAKSYDSMAKASEKAEEANENQLASFDQINKLDDGKSDKDKGSGSAGAATPISYDTATVPLKVDADTGELGKKLKDIFNKVKKTFGTIGKYLKNNFGKTFGKIWDGLVGETMELGDTFKHIWSDIGTLAEPLKQYFLNDFTPFLNQAFSTIGNVVTGLFDTFNMVFRDIWDLAVFPLLQGLINDALPVMTEFGTELLSTFDVLFNSVKEIFDMVWSEGIAPALSVISGIVTDLFEDIHAAWDKWGKPIFDGLRTAIEKTKEIFVSVWENTLKPIIDHVVAGIQKIWTEHLRPLVQEFLDFVGTLVNGAITIYNKFIAPIVKWLVDKLGPIVAKVFKKIWDVVSGVFGNIIDAVKSIIAALKNVVKFITDVFSGNWEDAWEDIKDIFKNIWDAIVSVLKVPLNLIIKAVNVMLGAIEKAVNFVIDGLNELSFDIPDWVPGIGGETFGFDLDHVDIPEIPELAKGTVVPANYGEFLAVLGDNKREAEVVSPLSTIKQAVMEALIALQGTNGGPGDKQPANIVIQIDKKTVGRAVIEDINEYTKRNGKSPLNA